MFAVPASGHPVSVSLHDFYIVVLTGFEDLSKHASAAIRMLENQKTNPKPQYVGETFENFKLVCLAYPFMSRAM